MDFPVNKKIIALLCVMLAVLALMAGCRGTEIKDPARNPAQTVAAIKNSFFEANADNLPALMELDDEMLRDFYGMDPAWLTAYSCNVPMMNVHATEIFVAHVKDGQMENVKAAIEARKASLDATWAMYLPAQYELVKNSITLEQDGYILFAVTELTDSIQTIFGNSVK